MCGIQTVDEDEYLKLVHLISRCHRLVLDLEGGSQLEVQLLQHPCHLLPLPPLYVAMKLPLVVSVK